MRLTSIAVLLIAGIFAGAQLGKIAPLVGWYQTEVGFSLVLIGWLTSMIGVFVALVALPAGWGIELFGARRSALVGSLFLAAGALALPLLQSPEAILAARLVEGVGYVILVIALPAVLTSISLPEWRGPVLAIWSCFVPVGFAISDLTAQAMLPGSSPEAYLFVMAAGYAVSATLGLLLLSGVKDATTQDGPRAAPGGMLKSSLGRPVVLVAVSFGLFVVQTLAFFAFMPAFIEDGGDMLLSAGVIALLVPIGNVLATILVRGASPRKTALLSAACFAIAVLTGYPAFSGASPALATASAVAFVISSGVVGSALYAAIPALVPKGGSVSVAIGLVAQAGGLGTLFGPPLAGWVIENWSWAGLGILLSAAGVVAILVILPNARTQQLQESRAA
ncbi:MFS transporter [Arvimicrobium flavum]|uniref:MFS transporter n=1 Tax=Arvimicrobium flavum TaxID=3393320 RepID=UPI00237ABC73|nr:MFS transporter [Mesorhizobium shangrilense]